MENMEMDFREDWVECNMIDLLEIERGGSPRPIKNYITEDENGINWIKIGDTKNVTKYIRNTHQKIRPEGLKKSRLVEPGDFILSNSMSFGRPYIMDTTGAIHDGWLVLRDTFDVLDKDYLYYTLRSPAVYTQFSNLATGSTVKNLNIGLVSKVKINLIPLPIQRAIVSKIEELFSSLDSGIADLKKAQAQLKIYRQAVLKKAFEGEFTKAWRAQQDNLPTAAELLAEIKEEREKYYQRQMEEWDVAVKAWEEEGKVGRKPLKPKKTEGLSPLLNNNLKKLPHIPKYWFYEKIGNLVDCIVPNRDKPKSFTGEIKWVTTPDLNENLIRINYSKVSKGLTKLEVKEYNARVIPTNSVVMTCVGNLGISSIVEENIVINQQLHAFLPTNFYAPKFLAYYIRFSIDYFESASTSTTVKYLNKTKCNSLPFPFCTVNEQNQIILEIESRLSVCDKVEETIIESLIKAKALRQSILKKAFAGKLLTAAELAACKAAPDYEPASVLLEKIKAEKAAKAAAAKKIKSIKKKKKTTK